MLTDPSGVLLQLASALEASGVRYAVGGSVASSRHGEVRATQDVDVLVELGLPAARVLLEALGDAYHVDPDAVEAAVRQGGSFSAIHPAQLVWFAPSDRVLERQLRDVVGILETRGTSLDLAYVRHAANVLGVLDLLEAVLGDAGMGDLS